MSTRRRAVLTVAAPLTAALLTLTGCGGATGATGVATAPDSPVPETSATAAPAPSPDAPSPRETPDDVRTDKSDSTPEALDFIGTTVDGAVFDGADLAGEPVVMWFWAPWCSVCRAESPDVAKVAAEFDGQVSFVGIAGRGPLEDMQAFVSETATDGFTHVADIDGSLWSRFGIIAQPSFVFVAPNGEAQIFTGGLGERDLRDVANQLLAL